MDRSPVSIERDQETPFRVQLRHARAGLTPNAVGALERGARRYPYPATIRALAKALGLTARERAALAASVPQRGDRNGVADLLHPALPAPLSPLIGRED